MSKHPKMNPNYKMQALAFGVMALAYTCEWMVSIALVLASMLIYLSALNKEVV